MTKSHWSIPDTRSLELEKPQITVDLFERSNAEPCLPTRISAQQSKALSSIRVWTFHLPSQLHVSLMTATITGDKLKTLSFNHNFVTKITLKPLVITKHDRSGLSWDIRQVWAKRHSSYCESKIVSDYFFNKKIQQGLQIPYPRIVCTRFSVVLGQKSPSQTMAIEALIRISDHPKVKAANPRFGHFWTLQVTQQIQNPIFKFKFDVISPNPYWWAGQNCSANEPLFVGQLRPSWNSQCDTDGWSRMINCKLV